MTGQTGPDARGENLRNVRAERQHTMVRLDWQASFKEVSMSIPRSPIVSEFETEEQAASYDRWFRAKVQASIDDPRPSIPHDQAMAEVEKVLEERRKARASR